LTKLKSIFESYPFQDICQIKDKDLEFVPYLQDKEELLKLCFRPVNSSNS